MLKIIISLVATRECLCVTVIRTQARDEATEYGLVGMSLALIMYAIR
jgi:hypothetical protein